MAWADTKKAATTVPADGANYNGSVQSDWMIANTDTTTVNTNALLDTSTTYSTVHPFSIPPGVTRVWVRVGCDVSTDTFTTDPVVKLVAVDGDGVPERVDAADSDGAGITLAVTASTVMKDGTNYYSDVSGPYDLNCNSTLYVLVVEAAVYEDGGVAEVVPAYVRFGN